MNKINKEIFTLFLLLFIGCSDTNYFMESQTPPNLEGFLGVRWATPISIIDNEFSKRTGAKPLQQLNTYKTSVFTNVNFLDRKFNTCRFTFDQKGLKIIELVFNTNSKNYEKEFNYFKERLNNIYGDSNNINMWFEERLELKLMPNHNIEIIAYRIRGFPYTY